ncbi:MAG: MlaE family ABC transporter permease [Planctomycetota bacterium]|jgi:phospholipid/cholesterol/gamma-HCH transport system permease protein
MKEFDSASGQETAKMSGPVRAVAALGRTVIRAARTAFSKLGGMSLLLGDAASTTAKGLFVPEQRIGHQALAVQMVRVGVRAIPIVILIQIAIGAILSLQMFPKLDEFGQAEQVATINAIAGFRELGPLMTAIVLSGFAGASIAAELGTMVTTEEIEALRAFALNPVRFLVVPRLLATVIMTTMLTVIADVVMVGSGMLTSVKLGIDSDTYFQLTREAVNMTGFTTGLVKAAVFGLLIGLIACFLGLSVKPWQGSEGVGRATTNTVVYSIVAIIGADALFTLIFYSYGLFD